MFLSISTLMYSRSLLFSSTNLYEPTKPSAFKVSVKSLVPIDESSACASLVIRLNLKIFVYG